MIEEVELPFGGLELRRRMIDAVNDLNKAERQTIPRSQKPGATVGKQEDQRIRREPTPAAQAHQVGGLQSMRRRNDQPPSECQASA